MRARLQAVSMPWCLHRAPAQREQTVGSMPRMTPGFSPTDQRQTSDRSDVPLTRLQSLAHSPSGSEYCQRQNIEGLRDCSGGVGYALPNSLPPWLHRLNRRGEACSSTNNQDATWSKPPISRDAATRHRPAADTLHASSIETRTLPEYDGTPPSAITGSEATRPEARPWAGWRPAEMPASPGWD